MHRGLERIIRSKSCLGCGLCIKKDSKAGMVLGADGFLRPSVKARIDENFLQYCPAETIVQNRKKRTSELIYGPVVAPVLTGWSTNREIRHKASSGGVITQLLIMLISENYVDGILHVGPDKTDATRSVSLFSTTIEQVRNNSGSRYAPTCLFESLHKIAESHQRIAVVGKPCDIAALKQYCRLYPELSKIVRYTFSIMCMGLPSQLGTKKMVHHFGMKEEDVRDLRYRGCGWPGKASVISRFGYKGEMTYIESWGAILGRNTLFRCKVCPIGFGEFADVTCGDAWYLKGGKPSFEEDNDGRSFIFMRTEKGKELVSRLVKEGLLEVSPCDIAEMPLIQQSQYQRKTNLLGRYVMYKLLVNPHFTLKGFRLFRLVWISGIVSLWKDTRGFLGRYWRDYKGNKKGGKDA